MSLDIKSLNLLIKKQGLDPIWIDTCLGHYRYSRPSENPDLFEQIWIRSQGKKNEAVSASVVIAVVNSHTTTKGLFRHEHLAEMDTHHFRSYSLVESKEASVRWGNRLAGIVLKRLRPFAQKQGSSLILETAQVRDLVKKYERISIGNHGMFELEGRLKAVATREKCGQATRLAEWPGVCVFQGAQVLYETTCLLLVSYAETPRRRSKLF